ncbi:carboxylesterase family protein [Allokutzneria sp. A3M-2-11 16]|uniref:carboxylesterase/lipase family protein n=1 Tax=Allokutzneria sp. A3M-2-11 16 TaxID=2962043 RepID=UPI0020B73BE7|nr:carboxylesterase family protein [Allokutzneria sp. A3M-2-11 16]MCP3805354.1 carboxylesterase family protein [Allokutzneria sp. A3M-2-11 16]
MTTVRTTGGRVRGEVRADHTVFHAIPYAANTVGASRFTAPVRPQRWDGVRDATRPGATAPAPDRSRFGELDMRPLMGPGWVRGEDYLTVTVRTPSTATSGLPVMVFVHGGGFVSGSSRAPVLDGSAFARDGVVFVSLNYRLGAPGWLRLPGAPDNRGLLDVLASLEWVQDNITAFGGDPGNVTLFGESAGASIVGAAVVTAQKGLFHRAISQSGNGLGAFSTAQADLIAKEFRLDEDATDEQLIRATLFGVDLTVTGEPDPMRGLLPFSLVAGTETLPDQPANLESTVDFMLGTNTEEGNLYVVPNNGTLDPKELTEELFAKGTRKFAESRKSYHYEFAWRSEAFEGKLGAAHAVELPFVFDTVHVPGLRGPKALLGPTEPPRDLVDRMHSTWIRFAETGDPGWDRMRFSGGCDQDREPSGA